MYLVAPWTIFAVGPHDSLGFRSRAVFTSPSLLSLWSVLKRVTARSFEYMGGAMVLRGVAASIKFMEAVVVAQTEPQQVLRFLCLHNEHSI